MRWRPAWMDQALPVRSGNGLGGRRRNPARAVEESPRATRSWSGQPRRCNPGTHIGVPRQRRRMPPNGCAGAPEPLKLTAAHRDGSPPGAEPGDPAGYPPRSRSGSWVSAASVFAPHPPSAVREHPTMPGTRSSQTRQNRGPVAPGLTSHGLRDGHQTAMRRDRVPRVLRRDRLGHGRSGDIADHYTHSDDEMIEELLASQTSRWQSAVTARARIDESPRRSAAIGRPLMTSRSPPTGSAPAKALPFALPNRLSGDGEMTVQRSDLGGRRRARTTHPSLVRLATTTPPPRGMHHLSRSASTEVRTAEQETAVRSTTGSHSRSHSLTIAGPRPGTAGPGNAPPVPHA